MKLWLHIAATVLVAFCVIGITVGAALGDVVSPTLAIVALGASAGSYALVTVPTLGSLITGTLCIAAIVALSIVHVAIPTSITELLIVALTGHFALTLPDTTPNSSTPSTAAPTPSTQSPAQSAGVTLGGN